MSTKIEWVKNNDGTQGETWNPVMGCTPISDGCKNCYARLMMGRYKGRNGWPESPGKVTTFPERLEQPFHWKKSKRIFVCSMSDLFHDDVLYDYIAAVFGVMAANPRHEFMVLTKRADRMEKWFGITGVYAPRERCYYCLNEYGISTKSSTGWPLPNVHLGVSVEDQKTADERIPALLRTPAAKRFVSYEPALGPVNFENVSIFKSTDEYMPILTSNTLTGLVRGPDEYGEKLDQIIVGAETGPGKRPMELDWARSVRDQCQAAGVPFFFKKDSNGDRELDGVMHEGMIK